MATVNKDFKIKSGLIVEGTTGTINGESILTTSQASTDHIIGIVGGETLITSVDADQLVVTGGELSILTNTFDAYGSASDAQAAAETFATNADTTLYGTVTSDIATAKSEAGVIAQGYADTAESDAIAAAALDATSKADDAEAAAIAAAALDATSKADAAQSAAETFATNADTTLYGTVTTDIATAKSEAIAAAEGYTDTAVANLVDSAPATLNTLNELAAALQDNPDIIGDLQDIAAGKQDTLTAGSNIDITGATISVTGLDSADISDFNTAALSATASAYDAAGAASTAETAANSYTDGQITTALTTAQGYANTAELNANNYANTNFVNVNDLPGQLDDYIPLSQRGSVDGVATLDANGYVPLLQLGNINIAGDITTAIDALTTDDIEEGSENLYFTDERAIDAVSNADIYPNAVIIDNVAKQVAATLSATTAGVHVATAFAKASYRSAEFLVKVAYGDHTEISKVLLTLDVNDNIAITEYGIVGTNGSGMTVSAGISGNDVQLLVTTANNNSTVTAVGTLLV